MSTKKFDIYEMITNLMIKRLEAGVVPWQMPWKTAGAMPRNLISKKTYRGFNFWYLLSFGFEKPYFLTFNQVKELGASVRKGARSFDVVFWKMLDNTRDPEPDAKQIPYLRYYRVFHIDDVEGIPASRLPANDTHDHDFNPIDSCERIVEFWTDSPKIELGKSRACYYPGLDKVDMPSPRTFYKDEEYYSTLFHELSHATGHRSRTNRHEKFPDHKFGSRDYSIEELVAEMGAAYLCGICEIENATIDNSAAYISSWLSKLKSDNKFVIQAASYAQRAVDYILEHQQQTAGSSIIYPESEVVTSSFSF